MAITPWYLLTCSILTLPCKAKCQYMLTLQVSRYCFWLCSTAIHFHIQLRWYTQQTRYIHPILDQCWSTVYDAGPWVASKHDTSTQYWTNVGPPSTTLAQHWSNIGWMYRVCWVITQQLAQCQCMVLHVAIIRRRLRWPQIIVWNRDNKITC